MHDSHIEDQIAALLLERGAWVSTREICERFLVNERALRALDDQPGLCSRIAISGKSGFKHIALATTAEWREHYARERKHSIMALVNLRVKRRLRENVLKAPARPPVVYERDSHQMMLTAVVTPKEEVPF
jgi:hypothetical protein